MVDGACIDEQTKWLQRQSQVDPMLSVEELASRIDALDEAFHDFFLDSQSLLVPPNRHKLSVPELQRLAAELGISGTGRMRKGDLVAAISARQVGGSGSDAPARTRRSFSRASARARRSKHVTKALSPGFIRAMRPR